MKLTLKLPVPHVNHSEEQLQHIEEVIQRLRKLDFEIEDVELEWRRA